MSAIETSDALGSMTDLLDSYDKLGESLPALQNRVALMQSGTEDMAKRLEERMRYLIDGYEYLDLVSSQIPESFRETAIAHKRNLLESVPSLSEGEKAFSNEQDKQLDALRLELKSISHQRAVIDVIHKYSLKKSGPKKSSSIQRSPPLTNAATIKKDENSISRGTTNAKLANLDEPIALPDYDSRLLKRDASMGAYRGQSKTRSSSPSAVVVSQHHESSPADAGHSAKTRGAAMHRQQMEKRILSCSDLGRHPYLSLFSTIGSRRALAGSGAVVTPSMRSGLGAIPREVTMLRTVPSDSDVMLPIRRKSKTRSAEASKSQLRILAKKLQTTDSTMRESLQQMTTLALQQLVQSNSKTSSQHFYQSYDPLQYSAHQEHLHRMQYYKHQHQQHQHNQQQYNQQQPQQQQQQQQQQQPPQQEQKQEEHQQQQQHRHHYQHQYKPQSPHKTINRHNQIQQSPFNSTAKSNNSSQTKHHINYNGSSDNNDHYKSSIDSSLVSSDYRVMEVSTHHERVHKKVGVMKSMKKNESSVMKPSTRHPKMMSSLLTSSSVLQPKTHLYANRGKSITCLPPASLTDPDEENKENALNLNFLRSSGDLGIAANNMEDRKSAYPLDVKEGINLISDAKTLGKDYELNEDKSKLEVDFNINDDAEAHYEMTTLPQLQNQTQQYLLIQPINDSHDRPSGVLPADLASLAVAKQEDRMNVEQVERGQQAEVSPVEKELFDLLHSVIATQQTTMKDQQLLLFQLMRPALGSDENRNKSFTVGADSSVQGDGPNTTATCNAANAADNSNYSDETFEDSIFHDRQVSVNNNASNLAHAMPAHSVITASDTIDIAINATASSNEDAAAAASQLSPKKGPLLSKYLSQHIVIESNLNATEKKDQTVGKRVASDKIRLCLGDPVCRYMIGSGVHLDTAATNILPSNARLHLNDRSQFVGGADSASTFALTKAMEGIAKIFAGELGIALRRDDSLRASSYLTSSETITNSDDARFMKREEISSTIADAVAKQVKEVLRQHRIVKNESNKDENTSNYLNISEMHKEIEVSRRNYSHLLQQKVENDVDSDDSFLDTSLQCNMRDDDYLDASQRKVKSSIDRERWYDPDADIPSSYNNTKPLSTFVAARGLCKPLVSKLMANEVTSAVYGYDESSMLGSEGVEDLSALSIPAAFLPQDIKNMRDSCFTQRDMMPRLSIDESEADSSSAECGWDSYEFPSSSPTFPSASISSSPTSSSSSSLSSSSSSSLSSSVTSAELPTNSSLHSSSDIFASYKCSINSNKNNNNDNNIIKKDSKCNEMKPRVRLWRPL